MTFTADEMRAVAEFVYRDREWFIEHVLAGDGRNYSEVLWRSGVRGEIAPFSPKLDGSDREGKQAADCIVAAVKCNPFDFAHYMNCIAVRGPEGLGNDPESLDLLTASISAILSHLGVR